MENINIGDRIRIKSRPDWPMPGGYKLADTEGEVVELLEEPEGYIMVKLATDITGIDKSVPLAFRIESVEKI